MIIFSNTPPHMPSYTMPPILYNLIHIRLYFLNKNKYNFKF
nr:MAG TPA: hypothetical protein [Caudoviricetes sp.]